MTSERLRLRSDQELEMQNRGLVELSRLLERKGIPHYLSSGTLLGAVREGNFIRWDWDVQFYFRLEDVLTRFDELLSDLEGLGFVPVKTRSEPASWKILVNKYGTTYEMTAWRLKGRSRVRSDWNLPAAYFENPEKIRFLGRDYICMTPAEDYLEFCYGEDWRTPKRVDRKEEYLAPTFYRGPKWWHSFKRILYRPISLARRSLRRTLLKDTN